MNIFIALEESFLIKLLETIKKWCRDTLFPFTGCMHLLPMRTASGGRRLAPGPGYHHGKNKEASKCLSLPFCKPTIHEV